MSKKLDWIEYQKKAAQVVAEGCVLLKNENQTLPLKEKSQVAVFGRIQMHYYKSGTGSGGMVNVSKVIDIIEGLENNGICINTELKEVYQKWDEKNPFEVGEGWGMEPWCQKEMSLEETLVEKISQEVSTAVVVIGRTAGEEQDNRLQEGSFYLTQAEMDMMKTVRKHFQKVVVLLNVGNIMDMNVFDTCSPDALLYVWQGGMMGGQGTADILTGKLSPSGKLPDTVARHVKDYPSAAYFGSSDKEYYVEDIFVGYRYFESFAPDTVVYPFGYGMSYTAFEIKTENISQKSESLIFEVSVKNKGAFAGKEVVQVYCQAPQGVLGKAKRVLCGFEKTKTLLPGETQKLEIVVYERDYASYDDAGKTQAPFSTVLEKGTYAFYLGTDVRSAAFVFSYELDSLKLLEKHTQLLAPVLSFERMVSQDGEQKSEKVPVLAVREDVRREKRLPKELPLTETNNTLREVYEGKCSMSSFISQLSKDALMQIVRGEGMNSPRVTAGTASAFGGVTSELESYGIPAACCSDGPSGMRLDCGTKAFSLPNGTMIAATFNKTLVEELFYDMGLEMAANKVDCLLGPGMNIHRHPLNGRNFEYFSEDPFLTGKMAVSELKGMHRAGVTGTIKHFCGNNQETHRHTVDSVVSERALREIYLKGFEMAVKEGEADSIMTTYGSLNGLYTAGNYDLVTEILREEWGFSGIVMTDWWANINEREKPVDKGDLAAMVRAQNDIYMVCADCENHRDNQKEALEKGELTLGELQRSAENICRFLLHTNAMKRLMGIEEKVEITGRPKEEIEEMETKVECYPLEKELVIPLNKVEASKGSSFCFALANKTPGFYEVTMTASSTQSELAQIPVTIFRSGTAFGTYTWNGTGGKNISISKKMELLLGYSIMRLYFAQSGLQLEQISFRYLGEQ